MQEEDEKKCLEFAENIIEELFKDISSFSNACIFKIFLGYSQILIENNDLDSAKDALDFIEDYKENEYDKAYLNWQKAELYIKKNDLEKSKELFIESLKYFESLEKDFLELKKIRTILAIKYQFSKYFKEYKYIKEIIFEYIELHNEGVESLDLMRDTYMTFIELATANKDMLFIQKVNRKLNLLKIVL